MEKGFYYNFKHDPSKDAYNYAYLILPYPAGHSENPDIDQFCYFRLYNTPHVWMRPLSMFLDDVSQREDNPTKQQYRFVKITDNAILAQLKEKAREMYPDIAVD